MAVVVAVVDVCCCYSRLPKLLITIVIINNSPVYIISDDKLYWMNEALPMRGFAERAPVHFRFWKHNAWHSVIICSFSLVVPKEEELNEKQEKKARKNDTKINTQICMHVVCVRILPMLHEIYMCVHAMPVQACCSSHQPSSIIIIAHLSSTPSPV